MTNDNDFDPVKASGEGVYRGAKALQLNEVSLNGNADPVQQEDGTFKVEGGYFRKKVLIDKPKDQKPEEVKLGKSVSLVFLKIRRKLIERGKDGEILRSTSEHNSKTDAVMLYDGKAGGEAIKGVAADLRVQFEGLRTVQIVYALLADGTPEPELVKLIVKGAALGSDAKAESVMNFYQYLSSFGKDEHVWEYKTVLTPVLEKGRRSYYAIDFKRGEKLPERSLTYALAKMKEVAEKCEEIDAQRNTRIAKAGIADDAPDEAASQGVDSPKDDINPDDIPF